MLTITIALPASTTITPQALITFLRREGAEGFPGARYLVNTDPDRGGSTPGIAVLTDREDLDREDVVRKVRARISEYRHQEDEAQAAIDRRGEPRETLAYTIYPSEDRIQI